MRVFTYGSLMFAPVWHRVVRGRYPAAPATVDNHARFAVAGETYPGMVARPGMRVDGLLYFDVAPDDLAALDAFEGPEYRRVALPARLADGSMVEAQTYLYLRPERLTADSWQPEEFRLERFLAVHCPDGGRLPE